VASSFLFTVLFAILTQVALDFLASSTSPAPGRGGRCSIGPRATAPSTWRLCGSCLPACAWPRRLRPRPRQLRLDELINPGCARRASAGAPTPSWPAWASPSWPGRRERGRRPAHRSRGVHRGGEAGHDDRDDREQTMTAVEVRESRRPPPTADRARSQRALRRLRPRRRRGAGRDRRRSGAASGRGARPRRRERSGKSTLAYAITRLLRSPGVITPET